MTSDFMFIALAYQVAYLVCFQVHAQIPDGTLSGRVTSSSGSPVPNARLIIKNGTSSDTTSVTVNVDGIYVVANILPGTYEITASAQGFADVHTTVQITADAPPVMNLLMEVGNKPEPAKEKVGSSSAKGAVTTNVSDLPL